MFATFCAGEHGKIPWRTVPSRAAVPDDSVGNHQHREFSGQPGDGTGCPSCREDPGLLFLYHAHGRAHGTSAGHAHPPRSQRGGKGGLQTAPLSAITNESVGTGRYLGYHQVGSDAFFRTFCAPQGGPRECAYSRHGYQDDVSEACILSKA